MRDFVYVFVFEKLGKKREFEFLLGRFYFYGGGLGIVSSWFAFKLFWFWRSVFFVFSLCFCCLGILLVGLEFFWYGDGRFFVKCQQFEICSGVASPQHGLQRHVFLEALQYTWTNLTTPLRKCWFDLTICQLFKLIILKYKNRLLEKFLKKTIPSDSFYT